MGKLRLTLLGATAAAACIAALEVAQAANVVTGTGWETTTNKARDAIPANVPTTGKSVTFSAPSDPLSFNPTDTTAIYTLGTWLSSGGATGIAFHNGAAAGDSLNSTIWNFTGDVSVTHNEKFNVAHDDGLTLIINGVTVVNQPGPTSKVTTPFTWTGSSGTFAFQLVYGECCGPPATLLVDLPLTAVPEPSTWALMVAGFAGLGFAAYRRRRSEISIVPT